MKMKKCLLKKMTPTSQWSKEAWIARRYLN